MMINTRILVERLTARFDLDRVFLAEYRFFGTTQSHLLLVLNPTNGLSPKILLPSIELSLSDFPHLSFEVLPFGEWKTKLKNGSLFYSYLSLPSHRLYASDRKQTKDLTLKELSCISTLSSKLQQRLGTHSAERMQDAATFAKQPQYLKATFMLYQSMEHSLNLLQGTILAKTNKAPRLIKKIRALCNQFPAFKPYFLNSRLHDLERLGLLDKAFSAVKRNEDLDITEGDYAYLLKSWSGLQKEIHALYAFLLLKIDEEIAERQKQPQSGTLKATTQTSGGDTAPKHDILEGFTAYPWPSRLKEDANGLLNVIQKQHNPEEIILLNYRTGACLGRDFADLGMNTKEPDIHVKLYLVAIKKKIGPVRHSEITLGNAQALILFFELEKFKASLIDDVSLKHRFFAQVAQKGTILRKKNTFKDLWKISPVVWSNQFKALTQYADTTCHQIEGLEDLLKAVDPENNQASGFILGALLEKRITLYLKLALGYTPEGLSLRQLIDFTNLADVRIQSTLMGKKFKYPSLRLLLDYEHLWKRSIRVENEDLKKMSPLELGVDLMGFIDPISSQILNQIESRSKEDKMSGEMACRV